MLLTEKRFGMRVDILFFFLGEILARQDKHGKIRNAAGVTVHSDTGQDYTHYMLQEISLSK